MSNSPLSSCQTGSVHCSHCTGNGILYTGLLVVNLMIHSVSLYIVYLLLATKQLWATVQVTLCAILIIITGE